ncbi:MAG TPA: hypothetical protein VLT33_39260 [Labilithrix sp.]|nr:hypothetical protein [Labilithrix sp.]
MGLALLAGAALAAACGSSETPADPSDGGAGDGSTLPRADASNDDAHDPLNGVDAGCPLKSDGPRAGKTAASVARAGATGIAWSAPENARELDGQFARATLDLGQSTEHLRITDFGFTLPASATVKGVEVEFKRQAGDTGIGDGNIELWLDGAPSDRPKFLATAWPRAIVGTHHYGQAVDTWGNDLTPALVGKPGFGVEIYALRQEDAGTAPIEASVESMRITVFYCE